MDYKKITLDEYTIHLINNNGLHTIDLSIQFTENVNKEIITYRNALVDMMTYATKMYDTNQKLLKKCQELYSLRPVAYIVRFGNLINTRFNISTVQSKYIEKDTLKKNIELLKEVILNPLVCDNHFNDEYLEIVKKILLSDVNEIKENSRIYATYMMYEKMGKGNYTLTSFSDLNILNEMNTTNLYNSYMEMIKKSKIDIFVAGNIINEEEIIELIKENFVFDKQKISLENPYTLHRDFIKLKEFGEKKSYEQSKLSIGYKIVNASKDELTYVLPVFDNILGNSANSLLMKYVREEKSLCYYIDSYHNKLDGLLIIESGIQKENYHLVLDLIKDVFNLFLETKISSNLLKKAKKTLLVHLDSINDSTKNLINYYYGMENIQSEDMNVRKEKIKNVSLEDLKKFVGKIECDTIFFLEGNL